MCDAKSYLRKIELLDAHINNRINDLHELRSLATKITSTINEVCVSGSGNQDKLGDLIAKIIGLQDEINQKIDRYVDLKREISAFLEQIEDADQVKVLHKRYFEYKPWEQIACEMGYSYRNVCYIHGKALQAFEALMEGVVYMRPVQYREKNQRGCKYCLHKNNSTFGGITLTLCPFLECPYTVLDKYNTYEEFLASEDSKILVN